MLTKSEYKILAKIEKLPGKCLRGNDLPEDVSIQDIERLLALKYLERGTLVPPNKESDYPDGLSNFFSPPETQHLLEEYREMMMKECLGVVSEIVSTIIGLK